MSDIPTPANHTNAPVPRVNAKIPVDMEYLQEQLLTLLQIHSPTGYTDPVTRVLCTELDRLGVAFELTRRGAVRATLPGGGEGLPTRAIVAHLDTLGAMVRELKPNGRLGIIPIGTWSSRFAEGSRVSIFTDETIFRGTILPLKASGHVYNTAVDDQPTSWDHVEVRVDENVVTKDDLIALGINVGDFIGVDANPELLDNGFLNSKHLDNKAGVAVLLAAIKALKEQTPLPTEMHFLFTISEEVGSGASAVLRGDISEMISVDNGTCAPGQESSELWPSICQSHLAGPFDFHLTRHLLRLCREHQILHGRDVFRYYRCDTASAVEAGNDIRTALVSFGVDASHGYERTHMDCLERTAQLLIAYSSTEPLFRQEEKLADTLSDFPETRNTVVPSIRPEQPPMENLQQIPEEPDGDRNGD